ncbi:hypothetical protein N7495_007341 [Penicillium taxi]|uniref:uncharacterized protein n=1 Tax=Penicillium taxi TaxID=168475 RepID=UPI002544E71B|nr:uncharacterized protein N7495_007341 [Penicillium taxi]KAJ5895650.1 hypothetical protein N7495_007341 [Penicillium taxi]
MEELSELEDHPDMENHPDMEDHPAHWADTLMGLDFWTDCTKYELQLSEQKNARNDMTLHTRFPFNLGLEDARTSHRAGTSPAAIPATIPAAIDRHKNRSISELRVLTGALRHQAASRLRDFTSRALTPEPKKPQEVWSSPLAPRIHFTSRIKEYSSPIPIDGPRSIFPDWEIRPSTASTTSTSSSAVFEAATPSKPLMGFHDVSYWDGLSRKKHTLGIDLFWPNTKHDVEFNCLKLEDLKPLCEFRNLRSLKITGMLQSYQTYIWQAVWLNLHLEELELSMILEPAIIAMRGQLIQDDWEIDRRQNNIPVYYGDGDGELHPKFGYGEYLDKKIMEKAKIRAMGMGITSRRISIRKLTLSGFVVDADPFIQWFDPEKLRSICFKGECIDAGLWLPPYMQVSIRFPKRMDLEAIPAGIVHVDVKSDVNLVNCTKSKI